MGQFFIASFVIHGWLNVLTPLFVGQVLGVINEMFKYIFNGLEQRFPLELKLIRESYPSEPITFGEKFLIISFKEGVRMLREVLPRCFENFDTLAFVDGGQITIVPMVAGWRGAPGPRGHQHTAREEAGGVGQAAIWDRLLRYGSLPRQRTPFLHHALSR